MNNDQNKYPKKRVSIDGVSPSGQPRQSSNNLNFSRQNSYQPSQSSRQLGDFSRNDGFKQLGSNQPLQATAAIAAPVVSRPRYDDKPKRKFGLGRSKKSSLDGIDYYEAKKAKRRKRLKIAGIVLLILLALFGFLAAKGYINLRKVLSGGGGAAALNENVDPSQLRGEGDGRVNILLLGRGGEGHEGADLTDTIILASIDPIAKEAALVSVPRDLYVKVPGKGSMKINSVFFTGKAASLSKQKKQTNEAKAQAEKEGFNLVQKTVEDALGVPVHYHAMIDFSGFKQAIDTVGGVDIQVTEAVQERMWIDGRNYYLDVKPGRKHMDGFEALAYSRSRHTSKRGDFDRAERQRAMIAATKDKILSAGTFSNPGKISQLLDNFGNHVQTDFSIQDLTRLYNIAKEIDNSKIQSIGLADPPNDYVQTANVGGQSVVVPKAGNGNFKDIQFYIRNSLKDSFLRQENANIIILNGTNRPGLATEKADELKSYGYNVSKVANAPKLNYTKTVIVDLRNNEKKYTRRYLEQRFKVLGTNNLPDASIQPEQADFVIILGSDLSSR